VNILGLDISTTTIGVCILNEKSEILLMTYVKPSGNNFLEKLDFASSELFNKLKSFQIDCIYTEQSNIMFSKGLSRAQVIATVLRFNGALLFALYKEFNILPKEVMASSARKKVIGKGKFIDAKKAVFDHVYSIVKDSIDWPKKERGQNKGKFANECFDMADAYIVAKYGVLNETK